MSTNTCRKQLTSPFFSFPPDGAGYSSISNSCFASLSLPVFSADLAFSLLLRLRNEPISGPASRSFCKLRSTSHQKIGFNLIICMCLTSWKQRPQTHTTRIILLGKRISKASGEARQICIFEFGKAVLVLAVKFKQESGLYCLFGDCANSANVSAYAYHW